MSGNKKSLRRPSIYYNAEGETERQKAVLKLMESGWILCCWRNSSPHNWFLEHPETKQEITIGRNDFDSWWVRKLRNSKDRVIQYWGSDSGMPVETKYVLRRCPYKIRVHRSAGGGFILVKGWFQSERVKR